MGSEDIDCTCGHERGVHALVPQGDCWVKECQCESFQLNECTCATVKVGGKPTGSKNWNPDCPVHPFTDEMREYSFKVGLQQALAGAVREAARRDRADTL